MTNFLNIDDLISTIDYFENEKKSFLNATFFIEHFRSCKTKSSEAEIRNNRKKYM